MRIVPFFISVMLGVCANAQHRTAYSLLSDLAKTQDPAEQIKLHAALVHVYTREAPEQAARHVQLIARRIKSLQSDSLRLIVLEAVGYFHSNKPVPDFRKAASCIRFASKLDTNRISVPIRIRWLKTEGQIHSKIQAFEEAHRAFNQMLVLAAASKNAVLQADAMCALGTLYIETQQLDVASDYLNKAASMYQHLGQSVGLAESLVGLARISLQRGQGDKVLELSKKILGYFSNDRYHDHVARSLLLQGRALAMKHLDTEALSAFNECHNIASKRQDRPLMVESALEIARIQLGNNPDLAKNLIIKALQQLDTTVAHKHRATAYFLLYRYYKMFNSGLAVQWLERHQAVLEAINKLETKLNIERHKIRFAVSLKEKENQRLRAQKSLLDTQYERQRFYNLLLLFVLTIVAVSGAWVWYAAKQRMRQNILLEGLVEDRTKQLQTANAQLKETAQSLERSNNELERFAYIASHDLKAPLRNIISFLGLIERKVRDYHDDSLMQYLTFASTNAHHMYALIQDILEFSRVDAGMNQAALSDFDACDAVVQAVMNVQALVIERRACITCERLPTVTANRTFFTQIFQNIISNGIKYNKSEVPHISITHALEGNMHRFDIADNGIGIAPEYHHQVFDMFKRLHRQDEYAGTGIGLAICKKVIEKAGGRIWLQSELGRGSVFSFSWPLARQEYPPPTAQHAQEPRKFQ